MNHRHETLTTDSCWETEGVRGTQTCARLATVGHCRNCPVFAAAGRRLLDRDLPAAYRAAWTARVSAEAARDTRALLSVLPFSVRGHWLGLRSSVCLTVVEDRPVHTLPFRSNPVFLGLVNVEGEMLPCASLARTLALDGAAATADDGAPRRILIASRGGLRWCFPVDETAGVEQYPESGIDPADDPLPIDGWIVSGERRVALLNETRLFDLLERSIAP